MESPEKKPSEPNIEGIGQITEEIVPKQNPEAQVFLEDKKFAIAISEARDFRSLWTTINERGGLQGSQKFYNVDELHESVSAVRKGVTPKLLTGAFGFRQKVLDLIRMENLKNELSEEENKRLPTSARILKEENWKLNFTRAGGERGTEKMQRFERDFSDIKKIGWENSEGPIDAKLIWTDGEGAIFEDERGIKFAIPFEDIK